MFWTRTKAKVYCFKDELSDEVFGVQEILAVMLDDSQLVIPKLESGNYLRFQPNTGDQCNVIPLHLYKKTTKDVDYFVQCDPCQYGDRFVWWYFNSYPWESSFACMAWTFQMPA